ncbi:MAG: carbohydrate ABC transporter permease [Treponema sp.]|jgi:raffinose/stachyose/melibiose transport system permease protein|nr:carbohydrate ABC transporter permease [Treponema sp.]
MQAGSLKIPRRLGIYVFMLIMMAVWIAPIYTLIATAVKAKKDFYNNIGLFALPPEIAWSNFFNAVTKGRLMQYIRNDLIVCCLKVPLGIFVSALAAFAMTRLNIKHKTGIFIFFIIGMMLPVQTALVPINVIYSRLKLLNTYIGLFYVYVGFGISYSILILRGFFRTIPRDIDDAGLIDGCSKWRLFWNIILPIAKPAIATLVIMDFLATWNEYIIALVIINDNSKKTVPVGLMTFVGEHGTDYGYLCAGVLISVAPVLLVYLIFQRYFVEGMGGAVKQ